MKKKVVMVKDCDQQRLMLLIGCLAISENVEIGLFFIRNFNLHYSSKF